MSVTEQTSWFDKDANRHRVWVPGVGLRYRYRLVMEAHLGRPLATDEHVHHVNGDTTDDRIENLELIGIVEHGRLHGTAAWVTRKARWTNSWTEAHAECIECGTTDRKHGGGGRCSRCYFRRYRRIQRAKAKESS